MTANNPNPVGVRSDAKPSDFNKGDAVLYVPRHAHGNANHRDCERGIVSSVNDQFVFVKYNNAACVMVTGDEPYTAQATDPNDLLVIHRR